MGRVLVACERSGVVRRAFRALGHDAWSCDIEPADDDSPFHIQGDVIKVLGGFNLRSPIPRRLLPEHLKEYLHIDASYWDMMIAHPECRYLANSGVRWLYKSGRKENGKDPDRWGKMLEATQFYLSLRNAPIKHKAIENPILHEHAMKLLGPMDRQVVQPWWFGDPTFKATGFELHNLPPLVETNRLTPPKPGTQEHKDWSWVHRCPPGPDRARIRSETQPGIAAAMAEQWGRLIPPTKQESE